MQSTTPGTLTAIMQKYLLPEMIFLALLFGYKSKFIPAIFSALLPANATPVSLANLKINSCYPVLNIQIQRGYLSRFHPADASYPFNTKIYRISADSFQGY